MKFIGEEEKRRLPSARLIRSRAKRYFAECDGVEARDENGEAIRHPKTGQTIREGGHPPTLSGLALALGFENRAALCEAMQNSPQKGELQRAAARCEAYLEEKLLEKDSYQAAKFSLETQFGGWNENAGEHPREIRVEIVDE